jgi:hypothetical protein
VPHVLHGLALLQLYEGLADQLTDIVVNAVCLISLVVFLRKVSIPVHFEAYLNFLLL